MSDQELNLGHLAEEFAKLLVDVPQAAAAAVSVRLEEGERREVTILFLDLVGYTRLAERLDPEQLKFVVSNTLQVFTNQVKKFGGTVEKFIGDAIMALFGRTEAHEDDSRRAVASARAILERLEDVNSILAQRAIKLHARIGINRGLIVTGQLAEHETVTGEALNIAQRLEANAPEDGILISESVYKDCQRYYRSEELPPLFVKNKTEPLTVYRIYEELPVTAPAARPIGGPFVGRSSELATMRMVWERTANGCMSIIQVTGEAGIGKSRLTQEFLTQLQGNGPAGLAAVYITAESFGQPPYHVLGDLVGGYLEQAKTDLPTFLQEMAGEGLRDDVQEYQLYLRDLLGLPMSPDEHSCLEVMEPRARQAETLLAVKRFLSGAVERERKRGMPGLMIIIDNQQWVAHASRDAVGQILQTLPATWPLLWVFVGRPTEVGHWLPVTLSVTTLNLTALMAEAVEELIRLSLPGQELGPILCRQVVDRTGGNPFFLQEVLSALARMGEISHFSLEEVIPGSIKSLILSRLDRLPRPKKFALQVAAVAGREFSLPFLSHVLERVGYGFDANQLVQELIDAELLSPAEATFAIVQPMVAEVAYTTILYTNRRKLHRIVAHWVEECHRDNLRPYAAFLAEQWERAGDMERAIAHYLEAGFAARARYAYRDGVIFFERALRLMKQEGRFPAGEESEGGAMGDGASAVPTPETTELQRAERLGLAYVALVHFYEAVSNAEEREKLIREGIATLPATLWSVAALRWQAAYLQYERGEKGAAEQALKQLAADPATSGFPDIQIECHLLLGALAWERGEDASHYMDAALASQPLVERRLTAYDERQPLDRYQAAFDHSILYKINYNLFNHYKNINELKKAEEYFTTVLDPLSTKHTFAQHMTHLFYCSLMWDRGVEFATIAMRGALAGAYFREIGWARGVGWGGFYRGAALWRMGQFADAYQVFTETLQYLERANDRYLIGQLELVLAAVCLARGDLVGYQLRKGRILSKREGVDEGAGFALQRDFAVFEGQCYQRRHELSHVYEELMETAAVPLSKVERDEYLVTKALVAAQLGHAAEATGAIDQVRPSIEQNDKTWLKGLVHRTEGILAAARRDVEAVHRAFGTSVVCLQGVGAQYDCHLTYCAWWAILEQLGLQKSPKGVEIRRGLMEWQPPAQV